MVASAYLQANGSFIPSTFAPVLYHLVGFAVSLVLLHKRFPVVIGAKTLSVAILVGVFVHAVFIILSMVRYNRRHIPNESVTFQPEPDCNATKPRDLSLFHKSFWPYLMILISMQLVLMAERWFASGMETGTVAGLNYAYRLAQFPNWVFVTAVTMVVLPTLARLWKEGDLQQMQAILNRALQLTLLIMIPAALVLCFGRHPIIRLLFQHGSFDERSEAITATILAGYSLAIVGQAVAAVYLRLFVTIGRMRIPVIGYLAAAIVNVVLDAWLTQQFGAVGIGLGAAGGAAVNIVIQAWAAKLYFRNPNAIIRR
jgi:putative peptidoglycan lipid II flippase